MVQLVRVVSWSGWSDWSGGLGGPGGPCGPGGQGGPGDQVCHCIWFTWSKQSDYHRKDKSRKLEIRDIYLSIFLN